PSFPTRRSSDLRGGEQHPACGEGLRPGNPHQGVDRLVGDRCVPQHLGTHGGQPCWSASCFWAVETAPLAFFSSFPAFFSSSRCFCAAFFWLRSTNLFAR